MKHAWGYATDQRLREQNQDSHGVFAFDGFTLAVVCDGMGGHVGGAEASAIAVRTIWETMAELQGRPIGASLQKAVHAANQAIYDSSRKHRRFMGMGTTVVACALEGNVAHIAHVGDSRLYAIREGEAHLLTRDHTMVNLFVEAELLSPEDAAAHPEAHVLARSLGVEPTVEVDLQDPLELEPGDVLVLCSDGVHGPIDDSELGRLEWTDLPKACKRVIDLVRQGNGDDNATIVVIGVGLDSSPVVAPTPPPPPVDLERKAQEVDDDDGSRRDRNEPRPPMLYDDAQAVQSEADGARAAEVLRAESSEVEEDIEFQPLTPIDGTIDSAASTDDVVPVPAPRPSSGPGSAAIAGVALLMVATAAVGVILLRSNSDGWLGIEEAQISELTPTPLIDPFANNPLATPPGIDNPAFLPNEDTTDWVFVPQTPNTRRRFPHRPRSFVQPPPGGALQLEIVKAAREARCGQALDATRRAMVESIDYGQLYGRAWECFDLVHAKPLAQSSAPTLEEMRPLLLHFEGPPPEERSPHPWYEPATDGIEHRLAAFAGSGEQDQFAVAMLDLLGPEAVGDQLMRDVLLEVQAARGLSHVSPATDESTQWWARRVYHVAKALKSPIGTLLEEQRPEQADQIAVLLDEATGGAWTDRTKAAALPQPVRDALLVGAGEAPAPTAHVSVAVRPTPAPTPDPEPENLVPTIHRTGPE